MKNVISYQTIEKTAVITFNNPPVNALGHAVRSGVIENLKIASEDPTIKAVVLIGGGRTFPAGADITEFGGPLLEPGLPEVVNYIENQKLPVIAAIHGTALGGGLEIALGAHFRIALNSAKIGLPEVHLGLLPGAGGTQRVPRIAGAKASIELMTSGTPISASRGNKIGIIDRLTDRDLLDAAIHFSNEIIEKNIPIVKTSERSEGLKDIKGNKQAIDDARAVLEVKAKGLHAPFRIIDCVEVSLSSSINEGLKYEREAFIDCLNTTQREGLVHAFFAERKSAKVPEAGRAEPRPLSSLAVIGGGTMGSGITLAALKSGMHVVMVEQDDASIAKGISNVEKVLDRDVSKGRLDNERKSEILNRYRPTTNFKDIASADMIIEAVFEEMDIKKQVFQKIDKFAKQGAVLASNTSYLDIDEIASATERPRDVIGLHFFSPANIMKLLEIVIPSNPNDDVVATGFLLAKKMRKIPVRAGNCHGFIGNRILSIYGELASYLVEDGASPHQVDEAIRNFGYPMGPFQMFDMAGLDIGWANRKAGKSTRDPNRRYVGIADRICEKGWFGQKTGKGFYDYPDGIRFGVENPDLKEIIESERSNNNITPKKFSEQEILRRYMAAMINEAADVVDEGIALRPSDVDVTLLYGYGFPRYRGGPLKYADMYGLEKLVKDIKEFEKEDPIFWRLSPLLERLARENKTFDSLN